MAAGGDSSLTAHPRRVARYLLLYQDSVLLGPDEERNVLRSHEHRGRSVGATWVLSMPAGKLGASTNRPVKEKMPFGSSVEDTRKTKLPLSLRKIPGETRNEVAGKHGSSKLILSSSIVHCHIVKQLAGICRAHVSCQALKRRERDARSAQVTRNTEADASQSQASRHEGLT